MATFNLADLVPQSLTFRDIDGQTYEAKTAELFGPVEYAKLMRLRADMLISFNALQAVQSDPAKEEELATEVERLADTLFGMIVPDFPVERRAKVAFGHKFRFLNWWKEQQQQAAPAGEAQAGSAKATRGRRSPASSASTTSTPNAS